MLEELVKSRGIISTAANNAGLSRKTHYNWTDKDHPNYDPDYAERFEEICEASIDFVESKLLEKINGITMATFGEDGKPNVYTMAPSDTAIIFYLKTKGKKRGYVEKMDLDVKGLKFMPIPIAEADTQNDPM